jgi:hypothetical protein
VHACDERRVLGGEVPFEVGQHVVVAHRGPSAGVGGWSGPPEGADPPVR